MSVPLCQSVLILGLGRLKYLKQGVEEGGGASNIVEDKRWKVAINF